MKTEEFQALAEGQNVRQSAKACHVRRNTAFRWRHHFLTRPDQQKATNLMGIAEADETFFLESFKGQKQGRGVRHVSGAAKRRKKASLTNKFLCGFVVTVPGTGTPRLRS